MNKPLKWAVVLFLAVILVLALILFSDPLSHHPGQTGRKLPLGTGAPAVAIGNNHGVILASDGSLWTWGETGLGWQVLGLGSNIRTQACLRRIGVETNWVNIAVGGSTTLALKSDGTIWAWGANHSGQLGDGTTVPERASPVRSVAGNDWKQVATTGIHSLALKRDGTLWAWGNNWAGQLGNGTTNNSLVPVRVGSSANWIRVWANLIENVGQQADGSLWFWGCDYTRSQKEASIPVPTRVSPDTNWVSVGMGDWMVFAIKSDGTLWAWGREAHVYTGANPNAESSLARVGADSDWRACASFAQSCPLFMKRDGSIWVMDASSSRGVAAVTAIVRGLVTNNQLNCVANSSTLGGDPAFGIVKSLQITCQLGGTNRVLSFREDSSVSLGAPEQTLTIIRALYGDPKLFRDSSGPWLHASSDQPAQLRRIGLQKDVVAFCGGRHMLGVALTADGEVWTWGEALGQHTRAIPPLQFCSSLLGRVGVQTHWGDPGPVILKEPSRLGEFHPEEDSTGK
jgi:alpha-tubulin suppressor-like RCC1 family protein